jgi:hypothetical protein
MNPETKDAALKVGASWAGVWLSKIGIHTWSDFAAVLTSILTLMMIVEWLWKRWKRWKGQR